MKERIISRRGFLNNAAIAALMAVAGLSGCTKTVTKYRPDGTPYTEEEDDWVATLAAIVIFFIVVGAIAVARSRDDDDESSMNYNGKRLFPEGNKGRIQFANMDSKQTLLSSRAVEKVSVTDGKGKLLVTADQFEHIEQQDLGVAKSILAASQISNLQRPIVIRLKQNNLSLYRIEYIRFLEKPSLSECRVVKRQVDGTLYNINVFSYSGNIVEIEIVPQKLVNKYVA